MILHCSYRFWQFQFTLSSYGERQRSIICFEVSWRFQFSLPVWGAMCHRMHRDHRVSISILASRMGSNRYLFLIPQFHTLFQFTPPRGERFLRLSIRDIPIYFSIHAPRVRSDAAFLKWCMACLRFQFSLPAWEAIVLAGLLVVLLVISILASAWGATRCHRRCY